MTLADAARTALDTEFGPGARVVAHPVDHHERCVLEVVLPDGTPAIAKCDIAAGQSAGEAAVLRSARAAGLPVPAVLAHAPGPPAVLVLELIVGGWLAPDRSERAWAATGAVLRRLHELDVPGLPPSGPSEPSCRGALLRGARGEAGWASRLGLDGAVVDTVTRALDRLLGHDEAPVATLHGDCAPIHVRLDVDDRVTGLLDFGDTGRGDPVFDLAVLTLRAPDRLTPVLDGYGADDTLRQWAERALPAYRAWRFLGEASWLADHGFDPSQAMGEAEVAANVILDRESRG